MNQYLQAFETWYRSLKIVKINGGPANGTIATTLVLLENLKHEYNLKFETHIASGGAQIKGASGKAVAAILEKFGEYRPFAKEGGRTNRGGQGDIRPLFSVLAELDLDQLEKTERISILESFQAYLVERVRDYHNRKKIEFSFDPRLSTWQLFTNILEIAKQEGKAGPVAQHMVGAKLTLRFPNIQVSNESASTADLPTNRPGDFLIGNTVFHVTVAPMPLVFEKCRDNLVQGFRAYLLVPDAKLAAARQWSEQYCGGKIAVESLESFLSQNLEEMGTFAEDNIKKSLSSFFDVYNERVDAVEVDKSLLFDIPMNLRRS